MQAVIILSLTFLSTIFSSKTIEQSATTELPTGVIYELDQSHSLMDFTARHIGFGRVRGTFNEYKASMYFVEDDLTASSVTAVINTKSLDTQNPGRDEHIRDVFFDATEYPHIIFKSTKIEKKEGSYIMFGNLTIKDVTKEVQMPLIVTTLDGVDQFENKRIVLESSLLINRRDYNVVYDNEFWDGIVGDEIAIDISFAASHYNALNNIFPWRKNSIGTFIKNGVEEIGIEETLEKVRDLYNSESEEYQFGVSHFFRAGWGLAQGGRPADAIKILELALEIHQPTAEAEDIANLHGAIAEVYFYNGQIKKAENAITAALKLDPTNTTCLELKRHLID